MKEEYGDQPFHSGCTESDINVDVAQMHISHHPPPPPVSSQERKQKWEQGQADYMGVDSFENIEKKLDSFLKWVL